ncbi:MAG: UDP-N-acetylmuramate dehydrogenase [Saprospiraceae bacterium]|nr:UDP-N-acetylmuramate dehydrogenase [Saprospiraceae bacterium]
MQREFKVALAGLHTFGISAFAKMLIRLSTVDDIVRYAKTHDPQYPSLVLGGGSNLIFLKDFDGTILKMEMDSLEILEESQDEVLIRVGAGYDWHELVLWCLQKNYGGIENLSLIPGTVGAAPIQNIGAYGVELKDVFDHLELVDLATAKTKKLDAADCDFGYRNSVFKNGLKGKVVITHVALRLRKRNHQINTSYGAVQQTLEEMGCTKPTIQDVSRAVIHIRSSKLPDPSIVGNAGSFFKNPEITLAQFETLQKKYPDMPSYPLPEERVKVPAGWLIDQCGWKGRQIGGVECYRRQALVLTNKTGYAKGKDVLAMAEAITKSVRERYGIELQREVNLI